MTTRAIAPAASATDRAARAAESLLRIIGDGRVGALLLAATGVANVVAALVPDGRKLLHGFPYALLLGAVVLSGVAAVAVRLPSAWREWRRPGAVAPGAGAVRAELIDVAGLAPESVRDRLEDAGYRARVEVVRGRWAVHGVRRGWSRFAGIFSHLALVGIVLGAAVGAAFGTETTFSLMTADQALLGAPRPGFSAAVRLDRFDAEFGPDGRPRRLDTVVTFLRDGQLVEQRTLRVNEPGSFDGFLVHPWTYGPAARIRVTTLAGTALLDAPVPLDDERDGTPVGSAELPSLGLTIGLALADTDANELGVSVLDGGGLVDTARLRPGERARVGDVQVTLDRFDAWVTFLSRSDPGLPILLMAGIGLCGTLAVAFWLPRRRVSVRPRAGRIELVLRGERFDRPADERRRLEGFLGPMR